MATPKEEAIDLIQRLPDDFSLDDIMYELYFKKKVGRGLRELEEGKVIDHSEVKRRLSAWLDLSGQ